MGLIPTIRTTLSRLFRPDEATAPVASMFQLFEQQTPQYPTPAIYPLTVNGYQRNEVIYACINKRAKALAEAPLRVYRDNDSGTPEEIEDHPLRTLLKRPNERMSEKAFWRATEIYLNVAGFAAWEYERNRAGDVIALWPMRPDFCSFMRGDRKALDVIRYQPWGLAPVDVPIENVLLIQLFDPIYPLLKALSPSAVALRVTAVDNSSTDLQKLMFERGAVVNGLLSSDQMLTETEATRIRQMWKQQHGGYQNWTDPAVLGNGMKYQQTQMNMRDMQYSDLDERSESRICQAFEVPPILINARVGIKSSTYSNYEQARKAFYEETISAEWDYIEAEVTHQLLTQFDGPDAGSYCDFDTRKVTALQEDRTNKWTRAITAFEKNLVTRDESREEMGLDPVDNAPVFYGDTVQAVRETLTGPDATTGAEIGGQPPQDDVVAQAEQVISDAQMAARQAEEAKARRFFTKRRKEGKSAAASEFRWEWHNAEEAATIAAGGQLPVKAAVMDNGTRFADALKRFDTAMAAPSPDDVSRDSLKAAFANVGEAMASAIRPPVVRIEPTVVNVEPPIINMPAPVVNITQAAQVIPDAPVPVVNVVNELPDLMAAASALREMREALTEAKADRRERVEARVRRAVLNVLKGQRDDVLARLGDPPDLSKLDDTFWNSLSQGMRDELRRELESVYLESANSMLNLSAPGAVDWSTVNQQAADWARQYSYELVNGIGQTSRKLLQENVSGFYQQGVTMADLKENLAGVFGPVRADAIAVTEVTRATVAGNRGTVADIQRAGMQMRPRWVTDRDETVCDICSPLDGQRPGPDGLYRNEKTGDTFTAPPAHVNCRCMEAWEIAA